MPEISEAIEHRPSPYGHGVIRGYLLCTLAFTAILLILWPQFGIVGSGHRPYLEYMDPRLAAGFALAAAALGRWVMNPRMHFLIMSYLFVPLTGAIYIALWWSTDPSFQADIDLSGAVLLGVVGAHGLIWPFFFTTAFVVAARWFMHHNHGRHVNPG